MIDRRNFIGSLLAIGAGFSILPPAKTARIWAAERRLLIPAQEILSVWNTHYISWGGARADRPANRFADFGSIQKTTSGLWFKSTIDWQPLKPMSRATAWKSAGIFVTAPDGVGVVDCAGPACQGASATLEVPDFSQVEIPEVEPSTVPKHGLVELFKEFPPKTKGV